MNQRKSWRCHARTVAGCTTTRLARHPSRRVTARPRGYGPSEPAGVGDRPLKDQRVDGGAPGSRGRWPPTRRAWRGGRSRNHHENHCGHPGIRHERLSRDSTGSAVEAVREVRRHRADGVCNRHRESMMPSVPLLRAGGGWCGVSRRSGSDPGSGPAGKAGGGRTSSPPAQMALIVPMRLHGSHSAFLRVHYVGLCQPAPPNVQVQGSGKLGRRNFLLGGD